MSVAEDCRAWVDSVYQSLTPRQRVAQLVFPKFAPDQGQTAKAAIKRLVGDNKVGGLLFSKGSLDEYADMIDYAQAQASVPLMVTFDGEWGLSMRIAGTPRFPKNMALGAIADPRLLYDYGREIARECKALGVHVNFAPVMDVNSNPANPVIGIRSYGDDPERVALLGTAYSLGLEDGGVMAVAKHFPGHGDTSTDSHKAETKVMHSPAHLDSVDLVPFKSFIDAGCSGIMTGHILLPNADDSGLPASLSPVMTGQWLRKRLGFDGLVFTDAIEMKGAATGRGNAAVLAMIAGADVTESSSTAAADIDAILAAVKQGDLSETRIEESCRKVLTYKYLLGAANKCETKTNGSLRREINTAEAEALNRRLTAATITAVRNDGVLPVRNLESTSIAVVNIGAAKDNVFSDYCSRYAKADYYSVVNNDITPAFQSKICSHDIVVAAIYSDSQFSRETLRKLSTCKGLVTVFFISPYKVVKFAGALKDAGAIIMAYEDTPLTQEYAAQALFGGIKVDGRLPVSLPGIAPTGTGTTIAKTRLGYTAPIAKSFDKSLTDSLDNIIAELIADGATPGGQLIVGKDGDVVYEKCFGVTTPGGPAVNNLTVYDLASVSKAVGTLSGLMKAYDMGLYSLDDRMSQHLPALNVPQKDSLTVKEFLFHETGFPASLNMFDIMVDSNSFTGKLFTPRPDKNHSIKAGRRSYAHNRARLRGDLASRVKSGKFNIEVSKGLFIAPATIDTVKQHIYDATLRADKHYNYSCLNFSILMDMEEALTGTRHDRFITDNIFAPLGAYSTCYRAAGSKPLDEIAPTEKDKFLRRSHLQGYVHDELAAFSGGVQGNAGLFANAGDIAKYCQMLLDGGSYGGHRFMSQETADTFMYTKSPTCRRGLGFDKPDTENPDKSPLCEEAHPSVIGHLGFTGTCFWIDPANNMFMVFLTNRVNPTRDNVKFSRLNPRPRLFRQLYLALEEH